MSKGRGRGEGKAPWSTMFRSARKEGWTGFRDSRMRAEVQFGDGAG